MYNFIFVYCHDFYLIINSVPNWGGPPHFNSVLCEACTAILKPNNIKNHSLYVYIVNIFVLVYYIIFCLYHYYINKKYRDIKEEYGQINDKNRGRTLQYVYIIFIFYKYIYLFYIMFIFCV